MRYVPAKREQPSSADLIASTQPRAIFSLPGLAIAGGVLAGLLIIGLWLAVHWIVRGEFAARIEAEARQNANLARVFEENTIRLLSAADQALLRVRATVAEGGEPDLLRLGNETGLTPGILVQLGRIDAAGFAVRSSFNIANRASSVGKPPVNLADREHFRVHVDQDDGMLYIGKPVLGRLSGRWTIQLTRRLNAPNGRFAGVITASIDPAYFARIYDGVDLGADAHIALVGMDSVVRVGTINGDLIGVGQELRSAGLIEAARANQEGHVVGPSEFDGIERVTSYRRFEKYPLVVAVGSGTDNALAGLARDRRAYTMLASAFTFVLMLASLLLSMAITRLHRTTLQLRTREAEARLADQKKSDFLANVSHELRTPLTSIRGFSELLEVRLQTPAHREQAGMIRKASEHLTLLLNDILDLSKIEAGGMQLTLGEVHIPKLIEETAALFRAAAQAKGLELTCEIAPDTPHTALWDAVRVKQILNNLVSNAVKFTAQGRVSIVVTPKGRFVTIAVRDTGPGIPPQLHEAVFDKFGQGDPDVSRLQGGTGLGLALARTLSGLMGGWIHLESTPGEGSCFSLELPVGTVAAAPQPGAGRGLANASIE